jgi:hypothetical protein
MLPLYLFYLLLLALPLEGVYLRLVLCMRIDRFLVVYLETQTRMAMVLVLVLVLVVI